jgi:hypothetical protein
MLIWTPGRIREEDSLILRTTNALDVYSTTPYRGWDKEYYHPTHTEHYVGLVWFGVVCFRVWYCPDGSLVAQDSYKYVPDYNPRSG